MNTPTGATALVVLSCHRSGTSLLTRVLALSGAALPEHVLPPLPDHPDGFWEPERIMRFNDHLLLHHDSSWDDTFGPRNARHRAPEFPPEAAARARELIREDFGGKPFVVFKEPRSTILWPFWRDALRAEGFNVKYVIPVREPIEVAQSLKTRNNMPKNQALLLWANYMLQAEHHTRGEARVFIRFEDLVSDPERELDRIEERLAVRLPRRTWSSAAEIEAFVKPERRQSRAGPELNLGPRFTPVRKLHAYLEALACDEPSNEDVPSATAEWLDSLDETLSPILRGTILRGRREVEAVQADAQARLAQADAEAHARVGELTARLAAVDAAAAEAAASRDAAAEDLATARREAAEASQTRDALQSALETASAQVAAYEQRLAEADAQVRAADEAASALNAELAAARDALAQVDDLTMRLAAAEAERAEAAAAQQTLSEEVSQARSDAAEAVRSREALGAELIGLSTELADQERGRVEAHADAEAAREAVALLEAELAATRDARAQLEEAEAAARARIDDLAAQLSATESEAAELAEAREAGVAALSLARREAAAVEQSLMALTAELHSNTSSPDGAQTQGAAGRAGEAGAAVPTGLTGVLEQVRRRLERDAAHSREVAARTEQAERATRAAEDRVTVVESALLIARRQAGEVEALLQRRITEAELSARAQSTAAERAALERDEATARLEAHAARAVLHAELERTYAAEDAELRSTLAQTAVSAHAAQVRVAELQAQLDEVGRLLAQERGRSWWSRLVGKS